MADGPSGSRARPIALHAAIALVASGQAWSMLELAGARLTPAVALGTEALVVAASGALALRRRRESKELTTWWAIGVGVFLFWAVLYFAVAHVTEPMRAQTFDDVILARLPLRPELAPVYLGVHVFGVVPFCALPELRQLRRHLLGAVLIIGISAIAWVALPVRLDRPPIPNDLPGFGAILMRSIHAVDPTTNCFPSAHCAIAVYAAIGLRLARSNALFVWGIATAISICLSTVMTHQHYVADVASGALLAAVAAYMTQRKAEAVVPR